MRAMRALLGLAVFAFALFKLYPAIEFQYKSAQRWEREQHASFNDRFPIYYFPSAYRADPSRGGKR